MVGLDADGDRRYDGEDERDGEDAGPEAPLRATGSRRGARESVGTRSAAPMGSRRPCCTCRCCRSGSRRPSSSACPVYGGGRRRAPARARAPRLSRSNRSARRAESGARAPGGASERVRRADPGARLQPEEEVGEEEDEHPVRLVLPCKLHESRVGFHGLAELRHAPVEGFLLLELAFDLHALDRCSHLRFYLTARGADLLAVLGGEALVGPRS